MIDSKKVHIIEHQEDILPFFNLSNDMFCIVGSDGIFKRINPAFERTLGYTEEELLFNLFINFVYPEDRTESMKQIKGIASDKTTVSFENRYLCKDGSYKWLAWSLTSNAKNGLMYAIARNVTERKQMEEELKNQRDELEIRSQELASVNETKYEFLSNMSHELKTPLTSIMGFSGLLLDLTLGPLNEKQLKFTNIILMSSKDLLQIINNILDLTKAEAQKMKMVYEVFEVVIVINEVKTLTTSIASKKNITLSVIVDPELSTIQADMKKFKEILFNLVSNAIKFSPKGALVIVKAQRVGDMVQIAVIDNGIGISKDDQNKLFQPFVQIDASVSREYGGTGLGLVLVKRFVELHSGRVWVKSEPGKGSTFFFRLPLEPVSSLVSS